MMVLHDYWRSGAAWRVRSALNFKGVAYTQVAHDLRTGAQRAADYLALNPQGLIPTLEVDGILLTQSIAIIEWLEEHHPDPPLLPADATGRAIVRAMSAIIASDTHPLTNLRVLNKVGEIAPDARTDWITTWMAAGFTALEVMLERHAGAHAFGDRIGLADIVIVPQLYSARRFGVSLDRWPILVRVGDAALAHPAVAAAHPQRQPDADPEAT